MNSLVTLGEDAIPAETVAIRDGLLTVQAYEYTGGLRPGDPAVLQDPCRLSSGRGCSEVSSMDCWTSLFGANLA